MRKLAKLSAGAGSFCFLTLCALSVVVIGEGQVKLKRVNFVI